MNLFNEKDYDPPGKGGGPKGVGTVGSTGDGRGGIISIHEKRVGLQQPVIVENALVAEYTILSNV